MAALLNHLLPAVDPEFRDNIIILPELIGWLERISPEPLGGSFGTNQPGSDFVFVVKN